MPDYQNTFLELLENLELDISKLYKLFAEKFPAHKQLWNELSNDEVQHAGYIKKLASFIQQRLVFLDEKTTKTLTIKIVSDSVKSTHQQTQNNKLTSINALAYSLSLEDSILEKKFYDYFTTHDQSVAYIINKIKRETNQHYQKVKNALEEANKSR